MVLLSKAEILTLPPCNKLLQDKLHRHQCSTKTEDPESILPKFQNHHSNLAYFYLGHVPVCSFFVYSEDIGYKRVDGVLATLYQYLSVSF
jgi:hypothetical protein